jgi:glutamate/aspartate transport system substrate-binding protein
MRIAGLLASLLFASSCALAQAPGGTLQKIKETNRLVIGFQEASVPFSYLDANQKPIGFAVDICLKIADALKQELNLPNMKVEFIPVLSSTRIPLLLNDTIDLNCASATNNVERRKQVEFTNTHFLTATRFISKKANNLHRIDDLKGKTVVSVGGTTNIGQLNKVNADRKLGIKVVSVKDQLEAFLMVETDRAVAYVMDDVQLAIPAARSKTPDAFEISEDTFSKPEPYGIILRKNDPGFKELTDRVTAALYKSPAIEALYKKWFQSPTPPDGVNFNYPMPAGLKRAFANPSDSPDPDVYAAR